MPTMQTGSLATKSMSVSLRTRRRRTTAPDASRPTTLHTFFPRSMPRTAIFISVPPFESPTRLPRREGGAGHSINFAIRVAEIRATLAPGTPIEVWFQDEMRVGQKNKLTYRWATKGSRPRAIHDQRTQSTYVFGAVCPALGSGAALVLPACNTETMQLHLNEIATKVTPGAHAILILDQAGWHGAKDLRAPGNISLLPLPPRSPELNPQENIWQFMRANWLSNRVFKSFDDIVDHCCYAWNTLIDQPWKIMSIARRDWALAGHSLRGLV